MRRGALAGLVLAAGLVTGAGSCTVDLDYACATDTDPPVAADPARCSTDRGDTTVRDGHRWFSAPAADVADPDERPVPGMVLDGDWYDLADRIEVGHHGTKATTTAPKPTAKKTPAPTSTKKAP